MARLIFRLIRESSGEYCLHSTHFSGSHEKKPLRCERGLSPSTLKGVGEFRWTAAVKALTLLLLRFRLSDKYEFGLEGGKGSAAQSLDYAISKQTSWLMDMFGTDSSGKAYVKYLIKRVNPERRRPGPVRLGVNRNILLPSDFQVEVDGRDVISLEELKEIERSLSDMLGERLPSEAQNSGVQFNRSEKVSITAHSFVPFFVGGIPSNAKPDPHFKVLACREGQVDLYFFPSGFAVAYLKEQFACEDVVSFLHMRRKHHLSILDENSPLTQLLKGFQVRDVTSCFHIPDRLSYVMSCHQLDNHDGSLTPTQLALLAEPSILGITDDPFSPPEEMPISDLEQVVRNYSSKWERDVKVVRFEHSNYFISWANVVLESLAKNTQDLFPLIFLQIRLQYLWYRLHFFTEALEELTERHEGFLSQKTLIEAQGKELMREYRSFKRIRPTAGTNFIRLKSLLIETSQVDNLYEMFLNTLNGIAPGQIPALPDTVVEGAWETH